MLPTEINCAKHGTYNTIYIGTTNEVMCLRCFKEGTRVSCGRSRGYSTEESMQLERDKVSRMDFDELITTAAK